MPLYIVIHTYSDVMPPYIPAWRRSAKQARCDLARRRGGGEQAQRHQNRGGMLAGKYDHYSHAAVFEGDAATQ